MSLMNSIFDLKICNVFFSHKIYDLFAFNNKLLYYVDALTNDAWLINIEFEKNNTKFVLKCDWKMNYLWIVKSKQNEKSHSKHSKRLWECKIVKLSNNLMTSSRWWKNLNNDTSLIIVDVFVTFRLKKYVKNIFDDECIDSENVNDHVLKKKQLARKNTK